MVYEGSNDRPLKIQVDHQSVEYGSQYSSYGMINDGFVFDYPYPSGNFPNGDYYNEDPTSYHAFPY